MLTYWRELSVAWGECDPFGLVYYPHMLAWFNDTEHACLRAIGTPIESLIARSRSAFVMGELSFRFTGPARYGDPVLSIIRLDKIGRSTLHWSTRCVHVRDGAPVCSGQATRVHAQVQADHSVRAVPIDSALRALLTTAAPSCPPLPESRAAALVW